MDWHWVSAITEAHKEKRGEILETFLTGSDTLLINSTGTAKAGDSPGFEYQLCHLLVVAQAMLLLSHV